MVLQEAWIYNSQASAPEDRLLDKTYLINWLFEHNPYHSYLEIGTRFNDCLSKIQAPCKVGVDPCTGGTHRLTSDEYFATCRRTFDVILIDGLHYSEQVLKDVHNSLRHLNPGGVIVMHDCRPLTYESSLYPYPPSGPANGDAYKACWQLWERSDLDVRLLNVDWGLCIIQAKPTTFEQTVPRFDATASDLALYTTYSAFVNTAAQPWSTIVEWLPAQTDRTVTQLERVETVVPYATEVLPLQQPPTLVATGDSHSIAFAEIPHVTEHWLGFNTSLPLTLHRLGLEGLDLSALAAQLGNGHEHYPILPGYTVIYCYGYHDVQYRIFQQVERGRDLEEILTTLIDNYLAVLDFNQRTFKVGSCVYSVLPPPPRDVYVSPQPYVGTPEQRAQVTARLNARLREECQKRQIPFLDVYSRCVDPEGLIRPDLTRDGLHLHNTALLQEELQRLFGPLP